MRKVMRVIVFIINIIVFNGAFYTLDKNYPDVYIGYKIYAIFVLFGCCIMAAIAINLSLPTYKNDEDEEGE